MMTSQNVEEPELFPWSVLNSVNFGCFAPSRCQRLHSNAIRKLIKARKNWHTIHQKRAHPRNFSKNRFRSIACWEKHP